MKYVVRERRRPRFPPVNMYRRQRAGFLYKYYITTRAHAYSYGYCNSNSRASLQLAHFASCGHSRQLCLRRGSTLGTAVVGTAMQAASRSRTRVMQARVTRATRHQTAPAAPRQRQIATSACTAACPADTAAFEPSALRSANNGCLCGFGGGDLSAAAWAVVAWAAAAASTASAASASAAAASAAAASVAEASVAEASSGRGFERRAVAAPDARPKVPRVLAHHLRRARDRNANHRAPIRSKSPAVHGVRLSRDARDTHLEN